jgi:hypothetical protein
MLDMSRHTSNTSRLAPDMSAIDVVRHHFHWFLTLFIILSGIIFLLWASKLDKASAGHDVLRDVGLSLLIAAVVGATYEVFARSHFIRGTMATMLGRIMDDIVREDIWEEVKDRVIMRSLVRENMDIFLSVSSQVPLPNPTEMWLKFNYDLRGLHTRPKKKTVELLHFLDDHIKGHNLPRFELIQIGGREYPLNTVKQGRFVERIDLNCRTGDPLEVVIERRELTYIPGSYNLTMTETTKSIELYLGDIPEDIDVVVSIRPDKEKVSIKKGEHLHFHDVILLPGQSIEFRFINRHDADGKSKPPPAKPIAPPADSGPRG